LEKEGAAEAKKKAYCDKQLTKTETKEEELTDDVQDMSAKIDKSSSKEAKLNDEVNDMQGEVASLSKLQAEIDKIRNEEHTNYEMSKEDLQEGLDGVRKALDVLSQYYGSDGAAAAMLQQGSSDEALAQQPATPEHHEKASGAGASIIAILETIEADFSDNLAKLETGESDAAADYGKITNNNKVTEKSKKKEIKLDTRTIKRLDKKITETASDKQTASSELAAVKDYEEQLKDECVAKPMSFEERQKRREEEIKGLRQALAILKKESSLFLQQQRNWLGLRGAAVLGVAAAA